MKARIFYTPIMGEKATALISPEDYLAAEKNSPTKHEYLGGIVHAMAGASARHNHIAGSAFLTLGNQLRGKDCFPINSDTKIRIDTGDQIRFYYPDVGMVCQSTPENQHYQDQPVIIIEVLSPSTRRIDQGEKKDAYLTIPSLQAYLLIETEHPEITVYERRDGQFIATIYQELSETIALPDLAVSFKVAEVYERIDFSKVEETSP